MKNKVSTRLTHKKDKYSYPPLDVKVSNLKETVEFLTTIQPPRNYYHIQSLNTVAMYIYEKFADYSLSTERQYFQAKNNTYCPI